MLFIHYSILQSSGICLSCGFRPAPFYRRVFGRVVLLAESVVRRNKVVFAWSEGREFSAIFQFALNDVDIASRWGAEILRVYGEIHRVAGGIDPDTFDLNAILVNFLFAVLVSIFYFTHFMRSISRSMAEAIAANSSNGHTFILLYSSADCNKVSTCVWEFTFWADPSKLYQKGEVCLIMHRSIVQEIKKLWIVAGRKWFSMLSGTFGACSPCVRDFNPTHLAEELLKTHDIRISAQTLRRWMRQEGVGALTRRRSRPQRRLRPRKPRFGLMVQGDGSFHRWFGAHRPPACLIVLIDDATNVVQALFAEQEYTTAVLTLLRRWVQKYGVPGTLYFDRRNTYVSKPAKTIEEQLAGVPHDTPFTRTCRELGIRVINTHTPEAKGRVERVNRTLQDRLIPVLRLNDLTTIDAANHFLTTTFLREFNDRFAQPPEQAQDAHLPWTHGRASTEGADQPGRMASRHRRCRPARTHGEQAPEVPTSPDAWRAGTGGADQPSSKVEVSEHLDGSVHIYYKDMKIKEVTKCDIFNVALHQTDFC